MDGLAQQLAVTTASLPGLGWTQPERVEDLAAFGGLPLFSEPLHVGRPNIGDRQVLERRFADILDRRWLTNNGVYVQEFEQRIARQLGVKHCVAMCNATVALEIAIRSLGLTGEVIVPAFTFIATAHALQWQEITPVFCDVDPRTHTLDPGRVEELITPRTSGMIGVHIWGRACDITALEDIAARHHLKLLFDAAHAFGATYHGQSLGNFGSAEVLSFHATKFLNAFEGGAVVTNDDDLAARVRLMKNFGFAGVDHVVSIGTNGKMSEVSAAMGLTSLESMQSIIDHNYHNYELYRSQLAGLPGLQMTLYDPLEKNNYQYIVLEVDAEQAYISRDQILVLLRAENVLARRYFYPGCHRMEPYRSLYPHARFWVPETEQLVKRVICLPTGTGVGEAQIEAICARLKFILLNGEEIAARLRLGNSPAEAAPRRLRTKSQARKEMNR